MGRLRIAHEHFDKRYAEQDMNVVFPIERLRSLVAEGFIGRVAEENYSISGYIPRPASLYQSGDEIAQRLADQDVSGALLVPV